jgi:hypothetical protein
VTAPEETGPTEPEPAPVGLRGPAQKIADRVLRHIPGTLAFHRDFEAQKRAWVEARAELARGIEAVDESQREALGNQVAYLESLLAATRFWQDALARLSSPLIITGVVIAGFVSGFLAGLNGGLLGSVLALITYFAAYKVTLAVYKPQFARVLNMLIVPWFLLVLVGYLALATVLLWKTLGTIPHSIAYGLVAAAAIPAGTLAVTVLVNVAAVAGRLHALRAHPEAMVADCLLDVTAEISARPPAAFDLTSRNALAGILETAATAAEIYLPRRLRAGGAVTNMAVTDLTERIAVALRRSEREIMLPNSDTYEELKARLAGALVHAAGGEWGKLPQEEPQKLTRQQQRSRLVSVASLLLRALLPLGVLLLVQHTNMGLRLEGNALDYATAGVLVWAVLNVLEQIDSSFSARLADLKKVTEIVRFPLSGGGKGG